MPIWRNRSATAGPAHYTTEQTDLLEAYNRGRRDERRSRSRHPLIALTLVVLALLGAWLLFLVAREGSFSSAGQVADRNLATAADEAGPALRETGEALKDAGSSLTARTDGVDPQPGADTAPTEAPR